MLGASDRVQFLNLAGVFEGGMLLLAIALGWIVGIDPLEHLHPSLRACGIGLLSVIPPFGCLLLANRFPTRPWQRMKQIVFDTLGAPLSSCRWYDLLLLAALAGVGEEVLFRGAIQPWFERRMSWAMAVAVSNVIFGLLHLVTPTYGILAGAMGVYFSWIAGSGESRNVLAAVIGHGVYDYFAFLLLVHEYRSQQVVDAAADIDARQ